MTRLMIGFIGLTQISGCTAIRNANRAADAGQVQLPDEMKQPRLWDLLTYLSQNGIEAATEASVFEFTAWPMYAHPDWADEPRKPRYEGATVRHGERTIIFAISPIEPLEGGEFDVHTVETFDRQHDRPVGATIFLARHTWSVAFTMNKPDERLSADLTDLLTQFVEQFIMHTPG